MIKKIFALFLIIIIDTIVYAGGQDIYECCYKGSELRNLYGNEKTIEEKNENSFLYVKIMCFNGNTYSELKEITDKNKNKNIILDLRYNQGGIVYSAIDCAKLFTDREFIAELIINGRRKIYRADKNEIKYKKIVLLTNNMTASSAELFVGAISKSGKGIIVGNRTYGKNSIQKIETCENGKFHKKTVGKFLLEDNCDISGVGILPDYEISNKYDIDKANNEIIINDLQMEKAVDIIKGENF